MNAGLRTIAEGRWLLYPTEAPAGTEALGPYELEVARDAPPSPARGLIAFSHGGGSTPWVHRGLLSELARRGYAVVALEHPGNNRRDNRLQTADGVPLLENLEARPRDLRDAIDAALALTGELPVAAIGESLGGYTVLALAGGLARTFPDDVPHARRLAPDADALRSVIRVATPRDPRIRAVVLLSPALPFFLAPGALAEVTAPILVRLGALDAVTPPAQARAALRELEVELAEVAGAGHFSFQTPFPAALAHLPPAQDPPGFDRAGYQATLHDDVASFLGRALDAATTTAVRSSESGPRR
ncbi:MAG: alpha/beta fold hydrolase [Kofleriaceae bacterium]